MHNQSTRMHWTFTPFASLTVAWTVFAVGALLVSEKRAWRAGIWLSKPAASLGFVALACGAPEATASAYDYAGRLLIALVACALGDVALIPRGDGPSFLAGLGCFGLGHGLYAAAFWQLRPQLSATVLAAVLMLAVAVATLRWLRPHVPAPLRGAVVGYLAVIGVMVAFAAGASASTGDVRPVVGAVAFAISDLSVARERFVHASFTNLAWGLPLYYAAQLTLAASAWDLRAPN